MNFVRSDGWGGDRFCFVPQHIVVLNCAGHASMPVLQSLPLYTLDICGCNQYCERTAFLKFGKWFLLVNAHPWPVNLWPHQVAATLLDESSESEGAALATASKLLQMETQHFIALWFLLVFVFMTLCLLPDQFFPFDRLNFQLWPDCPVPPAPVTPAIRPWDGRTSTG